MTFLHCLDLYPEDKYSGPIKHLYVASSWNLWERHAADPRIFFPQQKCSKLVSFTKKKVAETYTTLNSQEKGLFPWFSPHKTVLMLLFFFVPSPKSHTIIRNIRQTDLSNKCIISCILSVHQCLCMRGNSGSRDRKRGWVVHWPPRLVTRSKASLSFGKSTPFPILNCSLLAESWLTTPLFFRGIKEISDGVFCCFRRYAWNSKMKR